MSSPPWKCCVEFFKSMKLLETSVKLESVDQLLALLIDGVLLCDLVNILKPGSVKETNIYRRYSSHHISQFKWCKNISRFIEACRDSLHVSESYLFHIEDISELDFGRLINLLSYLSESKYSKHLGIEPFSSSTPSQENIHYENLAGKVGERYEEYLQVVEYYKYKPEIVIETQTTYKDPPCTYTEIIPCPDSKRVYILQELLGHEAGYFEKLNKLEKIAKELRQILSDEKIEVLFFKMPELARAQRKFYVDLKKAIENVFYCEKGYGINKDVLTIGNVFYRSKLELAHMNKLRLLGLSDSIKILNLYKDNDDFRTYLHFELDVVFQAPQQHICQTKLILQRLLKNSDKENSDDIQRALEASIDLCEFLNAENTAILEEVLTENVAFKEWLNSLWGFPDDKFEFLKTNKMVTDDKIKLVRSPKDAKCDLIPETCLVFFFETSFIVCLKSKDNYEFLEQVNFVNVLFLSKFDCYDRSNFFIFMETNTQRVIQMIFDSSEKRNQIYEILNNFKKINLANGPINGHLIQTTLSIVEICAVCAKLFAGLGYACKVCHKLFHVECINKIQCQNLEQDLLTTGTLPEINSIEDNTLLASIKSKNSTNARSIAKLKVIQQTPNSCLYSKTSSKSKKRFNSKSILYSRCILDMTSFNQTIESKLWYFGNLNEKETNLLLADKPIGTFLMRSSSSGQEKDLVLCIQDTQEISHCIIELHKKGSKTRIVAGKLSFESIDELIEYFRKNPLTKAYDTIQSETVLTSALLNKTTFRAEFSFNGMKQNEYLQINYGDIITILDMSEERNGFWLASINGQKGRIPWAFMENLIPLEENFINRCNVSRSVSSCNYEQPKSSKRRSSESSRLSFNK